MKDIAFFQSNPQRPFLLIWALCICRMVLFVGYIKNKLKLVSIGTGVSTVSLSHKTFSNNLLCIRK
jgi:hypothetical protein